MKIKPPVIQVIKLADLKPWAKNPRKGHAVDAISRSIKEMGYLAPIIIQKGTRRILAGHGRFEALKKSGATEVPCIVADLDDAKADLYTIADNRLAEVAEWDMPALASLLKEFEANQTDATITGFDAEELETLANWMPEDEREEQAPTPALPAAPVSKLGDLWELGAHRLLCGDATAPADVAKLMGDARAGLMNTDPPYGIAYDSKALHVNGAEYEPIVSDGLNGQGLQAFLESAIRAALPYLTETAAFYLWHPMLTQGTFFAAAAAADILIYRQIIWSKPQMIFGRGEYHWKHELCFYGWRRGCRPPFYGERNQVTVWEIGYDGNRNERDHPTQKPAKLFEIPLLNHTRTGEACYEPFCGSGSQLIAAQKLGRRCFALEIEPRYADVCALRWQNFTGKKAKNLTRPGITL